MSPTLYGNIRMAIATLKATKLRSFLTMLGVIIGVVSVVTIVNIGEGIKTQIGRQIDQLGQDLITVRPGQMPTDSGSSLDRLQGALGATTGSLSSGDPETVRKTPGVGQAVPLGLVGGEVKVDGKAPIRPPVLATDGGLGQLLNSPTEYGEFFDSSNSEEANAAVIGHSIADRLFGERSPLGGSFQFQGQTFFVRGVLKEFNTTPLSLTTNFNDVVIIPFKTAQSITGNNVPLYQILAKPKNPQDLDQVVGNINRQLDQAHRSQQQFTVLRQDQSMAVTDNILDLLTRLIVGIAAISLLVGGIGIMNVMLVSVAERTHEIGLRKALGASNRQIRQQFMTEAAVLTFFGSLIGVIVALLITFGLRVTTSLSPAISWPAIAVSVLVSLLAGIVFGTIPAIKAARKDPIDALRNQ